MEAGVERISIAPVKSLGLAHPETVELEAGGMRRVRRVWLVDEDRRLFNDSTSGTARW